VDGKPADGAAVWALDGRSGHIAASAMTQAGGRFSIVGLVPGSYLVQVQRGALMAQRGPFSLDQSGQEWTVDLDDARALFGSVEPPVAGVYVHWRSSDWAGTVMAQTVTDPTGAFRFDGVPEGSLWIEASGESGAARARGTAGTPVHLKLVPAVLKGSVVDDAGHAVTDFTVRLSPVEGGPSRSYPLLSPAGEFQIQVPPGIYEVSAVAVGYGDTAAHPRVEVSGGEAYVKLALQGSADLSGRVLDAKTRQPVPGAQVAVFRSPLGAGRWATLVTASDGTFALSAAPNNGIVEVRKDGYQPAWSALEQLRRAADRTVEIALNPGTDEGQMGRPYEGVGMQLDFRGAVRVASVFEGGPAQVAGVIEGDVILAADGQSLAGLPGQDVIAKVMGASGTVVRLSIQRGDLSFDVFVRRQAIQF
jgi:protocatechuate 3,4-dioxygenase beta subunit